MDNSIIEDFEDLNLDDFFLDVDYSCEMEFIESSKGVEAVVFEGRYYNKKRENKRDKSKVYACRETSRVDGKTRYCTGGLKIFNDKETKPEKHAHSYFCHPMSPIEQDIFLAKEAIKVAIDADPTTSIQQIWERKEIEF
jgi:hypothetical protein